MDPTKGKLVNLKALYSTFIPSLATNNDSLISSSAKELDWYMYLQGIGNLSVKTYDARYVHSNEFDHNIGVALLNGRVHYAISLSSSNNINGEIAILAYDLETNGIIQMATLLP